MNLTLPPTQLIAKYPPLIKFLDTQEGCPKVPGYVGTPSEQFPTMMTIDNVGSSQEQHCSPGCLVHNPAAVLDSLTVWVNEHVECWFSRDPDKQSAVLPTRYGNRYAGHVICPAEFLPYNEPTFKQATLALLTAICEALGWEGDG